MTGAEAGGVASGSMAEVVMQRSDEGEEEEVSPSAAAALAAPGASRSLTCSEAEEGEEGDPSGEEEGESGVHCRQWAGSICEQRMDVGPCTSQKCVRESCR